MPAHHDPPLAVQNLARQMAEPTPMRRGPLSVQYLRCNKRGCACTDRSGARHGPSYRVVRVVGGKTQSRHVPAAHADLLRRQVEAGQRFRRDVEAYGQACERWADAQLDASQAAEPSAAQKGASPPPSRPRSSPRSTRL